MSFPIQTQSQQFAGFEADPAKYAQRDRVAVFDVDDVQDYLAGPAITAGLNDTRRLAVDTSGMDPASHAYYTRPTPDPSWQDESGSWSPPDGFERFDEEQGQGIDADDASGYNWGPAPGHDPGAEPGPHPDFHGDAPHPMGTPTYNPRDPSFSEARRRTADDGGSDFQAFQPQLYSPQDRLDAKSQLIGGEPERWPTASAVPPTQPAPPAAPVWLGHTYAPAHRVGMPWRGQTLPGTVTHLEGTNIGIRWDDGQHSVEEASAIHPLYPK